MEIGSVCRKSEPESECGCTIPEKTDPQEVCPEDREILRTRPEGVPVGAKTSDYYKVSEDLPKKFNEPDLMQGYGDKLINPMYRTSNSEYGRLKPNVHTMSVVYHQRKAEFQKRFALCGNYRNHSLNTAKDQQII
ncbi:hypothetical protein CRM22_000292 [Opisthorchis felineus]|uniref:Uncharacterized protein n=1 Tax=Opisthorchis felineus TaxID=147828 RepID=A0A4S2MG16_OPIFE|nr:hypothetical protein CRM22_000292 [Opisthorchis felineus]